MAIDNSFDPPIISVVIPNYNGATFLRDAIDSVLSQEGIRVEVIVVDDGSTDTSRTVIESYGDQVLKVFQKNQGAAAARNAGLARASGEYIKFLDADDWLLPNTLKNEYHVSASLDEKDRSEIIFGDAVEFRDGTQHALPGYGVSPGTALSLLDLIEKTLLTPLPLHQTAQLRAIGGFDAQIPFGEDFDVAIRLHLSGTRFVYNPEVSFVYRQHADASRASLRTYSAPDFMRRYSAYERTVSSVVEAQGGDLPADLTKPLALLIWESGRYAVRCGHVSVARNFFVFARELTNEEFLIPNSAYARICRVVGPVSAEYIAEFLRRVKRSKFRT